MKFKREVLTVFFSVIAMLVICGLIRSFFHTTSAQLPGEARTAFLLWLTFISLILLFPIVAVRIYSRRDVMPKTALGIAAAGTAILIAILVRSRLYIGGIALSLALIYSIYLLILTYKPTHLKQTFIKTIAGLTAAGLMFTATWFLTFFE